MPRRGQIAKRDVLPDPLYNSKLVTRLINAGIKGFWNFSHYDLTVHKGIIVENVHLTDSLMTLLYKINEVEMEENANNEN